MTNHAPQDVAELVREVSQLVDLVLTMGDQITALYERLDASDRRREEASTEVRNLLAERDASAKRRASMQLVSDTRDDR